MSNRHQNLTVLSMGHSPRLRKVSRKSVYNLLRYTRTYCKVSVYALLHDGKESQKIIQNSHKNPVAVKISPTRHKIVR